MKKTLFLSMMMICFIVSNILAQNTLITDDPAATTENSAVLNIHSDTKGLLIPRITKTVMLNMINPADGLVVYQTTNQAFFFYNGSLWEKIHSGTEIFNHHSTQDVIRNSGSISADFILGQSLLPGNSTTTGDMLFYNKSKSAFRVGSLSNSDAWSPDSIGVNSIGMGLNARATGANAVSIGFKNMATGDYSTAFGYYSTASGDYSTTLGYLNNAIGDFSLASGFLSEAIGQLSTAIGNGTRADAKISIAVGQYNVGGGDPDNWVDTDPLFEIGNGASLSERTNAMTVLKNGDFIVGGRDLPGLGSTTDTLLFFDRSKRAFRGGSVLNSDAWSLGAIGENSFAYGRNTEATGFYSVAMGYSTEASGSSATAMGSSTVASGISATALGRLTTASGDHSLAVGNDTEASGENSFSTGAATKAIGVSSITAGVKTMARGNNSVALGLETDANAYGSIALGRFNVGDSISSTIWEEEDPLFEIGYGTGLVDRQNALTVLKNGNFIVGGHKLPGTNPVSESYMFYEQTNSAFRGGILTASNNWAIDSIGEASFSFGKNVKADGDFSTAFGLANEASGFASVAIGSNSKANAHSATAMGTSTTASGPSSTAMGINTVASGTYSTAMGNESKSVGDFSSAIGYGTKADSKSSLSVGQFNSGGGQAKLWIGTDPLLEVGNGSSDNARQNALTVLKNGDFIVGGHVLPSAANTTDTLMFFDQSKAAFRGGYLNNSLAWSPDSIGPQSFGFGYDVKAKGNYSTAFGFKSEATGIGSIAMGSIATASGLWSAAFGRYTLASGKSSTAIGSYTTANGDYSFATGKETLASADLSSTFGLLTNTNSYASMAIGQYNLGIAGNLTAWDDTDPAFVIGNGTSPTNRANAVTILKNGRIGVKTEDPQGFIHINHDSNAANPHLVLQEDGSDTDYTRLKMINTSQSEYWNLSGRPDDSSQFGARFNINYSDIGNVVSVYGNGNVRMAYGALMFGSVTAPGFRIHLPNSIIPTDGKAKANAWETYSDGRVKTNVQTTRYGLEEILELNPVSYIHHSSKFENGALIISPNEQEENIGFIAQEVYEVIQEVVSKPENEKSELWSMNYEKLTPVLVKAIQEQQAEIKGQKIKIQNQQERMDSLEKQLAEITGLVKQLAELNEKNMK